MIRNLIFCLSIIFIYSTADGSQDYLAVRMLKNIINISASYHGERLFAYGVVPDGCDVIVTVMSKLDTCTMSYKGKRGPLWMNLGKISFINCPHMYKIKSTRPLNEILSQNTCLFNYLGFDAIKAEVKVHGVSNPKLYVDQLFDMRIEECLYSDKEGAIQIYPGNMFDASFYWPSKAQIGEYMVRVFAVRDGKIIGKVSEKVNVQKIGIEQWLSYHAQNNAILYGIISAAIAVVFGVLVTLITHGIIFYLSPRKPIGGREGIPIKA